MARLEATRILIIDDDPIDRGLFRTCLEDSELQPLVFSEQATGRQGLAEAERFQPDCVLLDFNLPDIDGLTVLNELGGKNGKPRFAVVMLTALGTERLAVESMKRGLMDYLPKGRTNLGALPQTVHNAIQKFRMGRELETAQRELHLEKERYRTLNEAIPQLVWTASPSGVVQYANRRCAEFSGRAADGGWPLADIISEMDAAAFTDAWQKAMQAGTALETESRLKRQDGSVRWHLVRAIPERDDQQAIVNWFGTCTDIDDQKKTEEAVREQQKLDSIGMLAGGIAHDFNNLLTGIMSGTTLAQELLEEDHAARPVLELVLHTSERAAHLTRQLLAYAGKSTALIERVSFRRLIEEACDLVRASFPKAIHVESRIDTELLAMEANPSLMQQLVMNLLINGAEAIGDAPGRVEISAGVYVLEETSTLPNILNYALPPGVYVGLEVVDSGCGMDEETRGRVFEPFFTTKFTGRGLGLAAVYGIVRALHGSIAVKSAPGEGTTFRVHIPFAAERSAEPVSEKRAEAVGRKGRILLIDDEGYVRTVGKMSLEPLGHTVLLAEDGRSGIEVFRLHQDDLDLVLLDMNMPDWSGAEVLREIRKLSKSVPVAIVSGYTEQGTRTQFDGMELAGFIQKPFSRSAFVEQVARLLEVAK